MHYHDVIPAKAGTQVTFSPACGIGHIRSRHKDALAYEARIRVRDGAVDGVAFRR